MKTYYDENRVVMRTDRRFHATDVELAGGYLQVVPAVAEKLVPGIQVSALGWTEGQLMGAEAIQARDGDVEAATRLGIQRWPEDTSRSSRRKSRTGSTPRLTSSPRWKKCDDDSPSACAKRNGKDRHWYKAERKNLSHPTREADPGTNWDGSIGKSTRHPGRQSASGTRTDRRMKARWP